MYLTNVKKVKAKKFRVIVHIDSVIVRKTKKL